MAVSQTKVIRPNQISKAVSVALAIMASNAAFAQQAPAPAAPAATEDVQTVLVVGARASQQSAINRKKNADTAQDSIIAEDVGAFPDRNVADAISRISGVAVDRGDFGEGITVSIRGNGPDLTRVELDGQGVQQAGGSNMLGGFGAGQDGGRGVEMRQLSSDLIKSVDVVKGSTPDMTEGSLGGGVIIKTRNGLDFKKDYFSARVAATSSSINKKVNPDLNLVMSKKFLDDKLGVILNVSRSQATNEAHSISQGGSNNRQGPARLGDFDNSLEKTFSFQPQTLSDTPEANNPYLISDLIGGAKFNSASPRDIVTKSASAATKADCYTAFPLLTPAQRATFTTGNNLSGAINQRQNELLTCLAQWNDWTPGQVRNFTNRQEDKRMSGDIRVDYKVNNKLSVYAKYSSSVGKVNHDTQIMSLGGIGFNNGSTLHGVNGYAGPTFTETIAQQANGAQAARTFIPQSGYTFLNDFGFRTGAATTVNGVTNVMAPGINGTVVNVVPGTVKVDAKHFVTAADLVDGTYGVDATIWEMETRSTYKQAGGTYRDGGLRVELLLGDSNSEFYRWEKRASLGLNIGRTSLALQPNGLWAHTVTNGTTFDITNPANYVALNTQPASAVVNASATTPRIPAYTSAQRPLVSGSPTLPFQNARESETSERTGKIDLTYSLNSERVPFIQSVRAGFNYRDTGMKFWSTGGFNVQDPVGTFGTPTYVPGIYVPNVNLRTTVQICQDTPGSLGPGGAPCAYGYNPSTNPSSALQGAIILTPDQYKAAVAEAVTQQPVAQFYGSDPERGAGLTNGWVGIDVARYYNALGVRNYDLNCIRECVGSDGKMYQQPLNAITEKVNAGYLMTNFEFDSIPYTKWNFPFGLTLDGNFGYRMVSTKVQGNGLMIFNSIQKTANWTEADRNTTNNISTRTYRKNTLIQGNTTDYMPSLNANLWAIPEKLVLRYNQAKTIARPGAGRLIPAGTCTFDQRFEGETDTDGTERDQVCTGVMGNPELRAITNKNRNLSLEWYVNKDTMVSVSKYKQTGIIGAGTLQESLVGQRIFEGSDVIDEQTGRPLSDLQFNYRRWNNQIPSTRRGLELSSKTAFTFLPSYLRYTGLDANITRNKSTLNGSIVIRDLLTGEVMPVSGEPKQSYNWSLWYDDGALSARFAMQVVSDVFNCISGCGDSSVRNYPAIGVTNVQSPVYNPGPVSFKRGTRYIDAKIAYKFKKYVEIFAEARNLGMTHTGGYTGGHSTYADGTPNVYFDGFSGAKYMIGLNFKNQ